MIRGPGLALTRVMASIDIRGQLEAGGHVAWLHEGIHRATFFWVYPVCGIKECIIALFCFGG